MNNWNITDFGLTFTILFIMWPTISQITVELIPNYSLEVLGTFLCLFTFIQGYLLGRSGKKELRGGAENQDQDTVSTS